MTRILKSIFLSGVILTLLPGRGFAAVPTPSTPTGVALGAWLTAFNSGDAKLLQAFYHSYSWNGRSDEDQKMRSATGELILLRITSDEKFQIQALLKESKTGTRDRIRIVINEKNPSSINTIILLSEMVPFPK
jgi:hypothetical protein